LSKPNIAEVVGDKRQWCIDAACAEYGRDEVQFDDNARVIDNEDDGYWVQCWAFVSYSDVDDE
jgi:hypothetical protein